MTNTPLPPISATPPTLYEWNFESDAGGWGKQARDHDISLPRVTSHYLTFTTRGFDPYIYSPDKLRFIADQFEMITLKMQVTGSGQTTGAIYFKTDKDGVWNEAKSVPFVVYRGESFQTYNVNMSVNPNWKDIVTQFRIDPLESSDPSSGTIVTIDSIKVSAR
jgi:hypothetical protein